jgi:tetraprenyl-beta-curcumene synthase
MALQARFDPVTEPQAVRLGDRLALAGAFSTAARRYWLSVFPQVRHELRHWRERAGEIPDPILRRLALDAQRKRGNVEGAAAFAAFTPRGNRAALVRAAVSFQAAYDYLDVLAEQPQPDPVAGARELHEALLHALDPALGTGSPAGGQPDYYASYPQRQDGGYLAGLVDTCRTALATLPSYAAVAAAAQRAAERIVEFQSLNLSETQGDHEAFERWARTETPPGTDLRWWETAAAGGSSLGVHALIAAAAELDLQPEEVQAIERAYFPWIGGLHSLLDHLVDRAQDLAASQRNLMDYYASPQEAAMRMRTFAERAASSARALPRGRQHTIILAGMAGYYLSDPEAAAVGAREIARGVRNEVGGLLTPALWVFKGRQMASRLARYRMPAGEPTLDAASEHASSVRDERDSPVALRFER